jgi:hypothetical protein
MRHPPQNRNPPTIIRRASKGLGSGQGKQKSRAVVKFTLDTNRSLVRQNNMLGNGESQPGAAGFPAKPPGMVAQKTKNLQQNSRWD